LNYRRDDLLTFFEQTLDQHFRFRASGGILRRPFPFLATGRPDQAHYARYGRDGGDEYRGSRERPQNPAATLR
jgi:hypothetical protein